MSHLLSHSHRVRVVYLAPCGRKCLVSLMASSKDPSVHAAVLQGSLLSGSSQSGPIRDVRLHSYAKVQNWDLVQDGLGGEEDAF